jgi:hypothetical protein
MQGGKSITVTEREVVKTPPQSEQGIETAIDSGQQPVCKHCLAKDAEIKAKDTRIMVLDP